MNDISNVSQENSQRLSTDDETIVTSDGSAHMDEPIDVLFSQSLLANANDEQKRHMVQFQLSIMEVFILLIYLI